MRTSVKVPIAVQSCLKGRRHGFHLWIPIPSASHIAYLPSEAVRFCEGEEENSP